MSDNQRVLEDARPRRIARCVVAAAALLVLCAAPARAADGATVLLTIFFRHDQSKTLDESNAELAKAGFYKAFSPGDHGGVVVVARQNAILGELLTFLEPQQRLGRSCFACFSCCSAASDQRAAELLLENLALRQQLAAFAHSERRPRIRAADRLLWIALRRLWSRWVDVLVFVKPETVI